MNHTEAISNLAAAFDALYDAEVQRLYRWIERGRPILCGDKAQLFVDRLGGA